MGRMIILGSGTALPDRDRDNTFLAWDSGDGVLLIDCGGRAYQQLLRAGIEPASLRAVILTHAHPDHIYGLPALVFHLWLAGYQGTLTVRANPPTLATTQRLCDALELQQKGHMCAVEWSTIDDGGERLVEQTERYTISTMPVQHSVPCLAVKIIDATSGQTIVYSSDTEPCPEVDQFAVGAHTLIHEATTAEPKPGLGHTTPRQAGEIAARAGVERLVLIHFSAQYTMPEADAVQQVRAAGFGGQVEIARDLAEYVL
ncbi:MAG: MBL fold metallo-hydrolase [Chloroflexota bacterium]|nr:MBL fold metallo-hydrolase [Chloroflexota bacterium]